MGAFLSATSAKKLVVEVFETYFHVSFVFKVQQSYYNQIFQSNKDSSHTISIVNDLNYRQVHVKNSVSEQ